MRRTAALLISCLLSGCAALLGNQSPRQEFIVLDDGFACQAAPGAQSERSLLIQRVQAPVYLSGQRIYFGDAPGLRSSYQYLFWAVPPVESLAIVLRRRLECEGGFKQISLSNQILTADLSLEIRLEDFFLDTSKSTPEFVINASAQLISLAARSEISRKDFHLSVAAAGKDVSQIGQAASQASTQLVEVITKWIEEQRVE